MKTIKVKSFEEAKEARAADEAARIIIEESGRCRILLEPGKAPRKISFAPRSDQ